MAQVTKPLEGEAVEARAVGHSWAIPRWWWAHIAFPFAITRLFILVVGVLATQILPQNPIAYHVSDNPALDMWSRWDAMWYIRIAEYGYSYVPGEQSTIAFYPLFPALLKGLTLILTLGRPPTLAEYTIGGLLIANLAFLLALTALYLLTELEFDRDVAARATWFLTIYPGSIFLSAPYAEPVTMALVIGSFYLARRRLWGWGGYIAFLAAISRLVGAFVFIPFAYAVYHEWRKTRQVGTTWVAIVFPLFGGLLFPLYLFWRFGDPLAIINVQKAWQRQPGAIWDTFLRYLYEPVNAHAYSMSALDLGFTLVALAFIALGLRKLPWHYTLFAALVLYASIGTGTLTSLIRHSMGPFPIFMTMAWYARHRPVYEGLTVASLTLLGLLSALFALWHWVA